jgi:hypothetical protein
MAALATPLWRAAVNGGDKPDNPFIGPKPFMIGQALYGRDWETRTLLNLLLSKRLVLLHSPSGAGKTSLIHAGLWPRLAVTFQVRPTIRLDAVPDSSDTSINRYVYSTFRSLEPSRATELSSMRLSDHRSASEEAKPEIWIFDQFEEVLNLDPIDDTEKQLFFEQLAEALGHAEEPRWALFAMREDYLGAMEPYLKLLPTGLSARFRLELLDPDGARQAIQKPAAGAGLVFADDAARRLVDDLRRMRADRPRGPEQVPGPYIEPVQLQVVCRQLWEELPRTTTTIDKEHVDASGNVNRALSRYYEAQVRKVVHETGMHELVLRDWFDQELITERGFRDQTSRGPGDGGKRTNHALQLLTDAHVIRAERRRDVTWYELAHDRLLEPLQTSNRIWRQENLEYQKHKAGEGDRYSRSAKASPRIPTRQQAVRGARWIYILTRAWLRKNSVIIQMNILVATVFFLAWWVAWPPPVASSTGGLAIALVAGWLLSLLPGWIYIRYLRERVASLWDEYVLNLHRLAQDRPRHLPKPPVNSSFFVAWSNDGGEILAEQQNIYRQKFDAYYGRSTSDRTKDGPIKIETLIPVFLVTAMFAVCWTAVLWYPSSILTPTSVWDILKFAFLGVYIFSVLILIRRYLQSDLRPSTYTSVILRTIVVLVLAAAVSKLLPTNSLRSLALIVFVVGFFPLSGILALQRVAAAALRAFVPQQPRDYPLSQLDGLSLWYESRLVDEGIEDMQNLATANLVDVILHTRVPVGRLVDWVDQAVLYLHLDGIDRDPLEHSRNGLGDKNDRSAISQGSVMHKSRARTRTALRQLGIRTATDLLKAFPPQQFDPDSIPEPDSPTTAPLGALRSVGLGPDQVFTTVRLLNGDPALTAVWNWKRPETGIAESHRREGVTMAVSGGTGDAGEPNASEPNASEPNASEPNAGTATESSRPPRWWNRFFHVGNWLAFLALGLPVLGALWITIYSFSTPGQHWSYLGTGMLTALAAFLAGCVIGFLFGIPRVVSSGELRHEQGSAAYTPSSNLAEVSDWLTKLLLGAGLVQLTRLGAPIGHLIDSVAAGLTAATGTPVPSSAAKVMAGAILFGYAAIGLLDAYVVTTMWYQEKLEKLAGT